MFRIILLSALLGLNVSMLYRCTKQLRLSSCTPPEPIKTVCGFTSQGNEVYFSNVCLACSHQDIVAYSLERCYRYPTVSLSFRQEEQLQNRLWWDIPLPNQKGVVAVYLNFTYNCSSFGQFCITKTVCNEDGKQFKSNCESCKANPNKTLSFTPCSQKRIIKSEITEFLNLPQEVRQSNWIKRNTSNPFQSLQQKVQIFNNKEYKYYLHHSFPGYESIFQDFTPQALPSGPWYVCPQNVMNNCTQKNIVVCGSSLRFSMTKTFMDYCSACSYEGAKYFTAGKCPRSVMAELPVSNPIPGKNNLLEAINKILPNPRGYVAGNTEYFQDSYQFFQFNEYKHRFVPNKKFKIYRSPLQQEIIAQYISSLRIPCNQTIECKMTDDKPVCGIFSYGYNRTFESACAACKHPNVIAYALRICQPNSETLVQYSIVAGINVSSTKCPETEKLVCNQTEQKNKVCGLTKDGRLTDFSSICSACKANGILSYINSSCLKVPQRVTSTSRQETMQYDSQYGNELEASPGYSLELPKGLRTNPCSAAQRTVQCARTTTSPVCGYWSKTMYRTYSNQCQACSEIYVTSYSYGPCQGESIDVKRTDANMQEFECRGPLRSIATCSLRKDPVCYRASNGLMKSYINNCIACHTAAPSKNFTMGGGCYGTDFSMKAIILKMLEAERRLIESNMNVEMM